MQSMVGIVTEDINNTFFGGNQNIRLSSIIKEIASLEEQLRNKKKEKLELESVNFVVTEESIKGLLEEYPELDYSIGINKAPYKMRLNFNNLSQRYHLAHGNYNNLEAFNRTVYYCTFPIYTYRVDLVDNNRISISNRTNVPLDGDKVFNCSETFYDTFSHPHVRLSYTFGKCFDAGDGNVCLGNNKFTQNISNNTISPTALLNLIRNVGTWLQDINMNDKWGSPSYSAFVSVVLPYKKDEVDSLFYDVLETFKNGDTFTSSQHDRWCSLFENIVGKNTDLISSIVMFELLYTVWLKLHHDTLTSLCYYVANNVFLQALNTQLSIVSCEILHEFGQYYLNNTRLLKETLQAPKVLAELLKLHSPNDFSRKFGNTILNNL